MKIAKRSKDVWIALVFLLLIELGIGIYVFATDSKLYVYKGDVTHIDTLSVIKTEVRHDYAYDYTCVVHYTSPEIAGNSEYIMKFRKINGECVMIENAPDDGHQYDCKSYGYMEKHGFGKLYVFSLDVFSIKACLVGIQICLLVFIYQLFRCTIDEEKVLKSGNDVGHIII